MASRVSGAIHARDGRRRPNLAVLEGGARTPATTTVLISDLENTHLELVAARAERTVYSARVHDLIRQVARHIATAHYAAAGTSLMEMDRLTAQEQGRARAMEAAACPCGNDGAGHGPADDAVLAIPVRRAS